MITQHLVEHWLKDGFKNKEQGLRSVAASIGASMLLAQVRNPLKIRPSRAIGAVALLAVASIDWSKFARSKHQPEGCPSYRDDGCKCSQTPVDEIDEAAMESFP